MHGRRVSISDQVEKLSEVVPAEGNGQEDAEQSPWVRSERSLSTGRSDRTQIPKKYTPGAT